MLRRSLDDVWFTFITILTLMPFCTLAHGAIHIVNAGRSVQPVIDQSANGDVIILRDGIYHESLNIHRSITLRAEHGGEATVTNRHEGSITWTETSPASQTWSAPGIDWPVHGLLVEGLHAFDYRSKENFDNRRCGPYWSKGWQGGSRSYKKPPIYFAHDAATSTLWLRLNDARNPNGIRIDFNSSDIDGETLVQKDLGTYWNQQEIVIVSPNPPVHPITLWYSGTPGNPGSLREIDFPKICGIVIDVNADDVTLEGLRIQMAPTVGVEVNNSRHVTIRNCYFSGYQFAVNTGYECINLTVEHCEMDGGELISFGGHDNVTKHMWNHSTYVNPIKFNGTGLTFHHNYVYEGFDLFQPRGRHKDYPHVPDLRSDVAYNVWQNAIDNAMEFDGVEALMNMRVHHNLILQDHDALAITTTENGGPLTIDHNIWWPGGGRIMKLTGTGRRNNGVQFVHNTYFTGNQCSHNTFGDSVFENNIVVSGCQQIGCWSPQTLGAFFPTRYNLLLNGERYTVDFEGPTAGPKFGQTADTLFLPQPGSPAIDTGIAKQGYHQEYVADGKPDLGALEHGQTIDDWRELFGHAGPSWITEANAARKSPHRPAWPERLDKRWGGLDSGK
ncbi:MAG: hypothetical protein ACC628_08620 [Pirellulaceae bacterium]